jgi:PAS domain-containing protein
VHSAAFQHEGERCIVAVARDLSGRRDAELRYRELMETLDRGILVRNAEQRIVYANPAAIRMFEVEPALAWTRSCGPTLEGVRRERA